MDTCMDIRCFVEYSTACLPLMTLSPGLRQADGAREQAKLKARVQKRREYMDRESGRNDGPFFALLLSFFVLPAAVILIIAFSSGYLDTIADSYRRF